MDRREEQADGKGSAVCDGSGAAAPVAGRWCRRESNIISALVEAMVRLMVQEPSKASRAIFWVVVAATKVALKGRSAPAMVRAGPGAHRGGRDQGGGAAGPRHWGAVSVEPDGLFGRQLRGP